MRTFLSYILLALSFLWVNPCFTQNVNQNYVRIRVMLDESGERALETIQYYDGLGRPSLSVQKGATPSGSNLVGLQEYDAQGRESKSWLPVVSGADYLTATDFKSTASGYYGTGERPYNSNEYEASPLNRVLKTYGPGVAWSDHPVSADYLVNTASGDLNCKNYVVSESGTLVDSGYYPSGELYVLKSTNEDNSVSYVFTDKLNRQLLVRKISEGVPHDTYFVYDDYGNQCFVLPPGYQDEANLALYAYQYKYDGRNRCTEKKLPGCDPIYYVYDQADKLIFSQDGVQREHQEWTFYLYDAFGRLTVQGICRNPNPVSASESVVTCTLARNGAQISATGLINSGYSSSYALTSPTVHLVNYYDNYNFLSLDMFSAAKGFTAPQGDAVGLPTGHITALLDNPSSRLCSATYYDVKGRPVKEVEENHLGGYEESVTTYTFTGKPLAVLRKHVAPGKMTLTETYTYHYNDNVEQLISVTHQLNNASPIRLYVNTYDDLGRLYTLTYHDKEQLKSTYSYNIRNWLSQISGSYFTQNLFYESKGQYGGNIGRMTWKSSEEGVVRGYDFYYDELDRLLGTSYSENDFALYYYDTSYGYDKMGNMKTVRRNGLVSKPSTFGTVDDFTNTYVGNQLLSTLSHVRDVPLYYGALSSNSTVKKRISAYSYDSNGNLIKDTGKQISGIEYNALNLPQSIQFTDRKSIHYSYSADGVRRRRHYIVPDIVTAMPLSSVMNAGSPVVGKPVIPGVLPAETDPENLLDYCGNVIYENNKLSKILTDVGYITLSAGSPVYHYYLHDHQDNVRVVMDQNAKVEELNHYYPYGGLFGESLHSGTQAYKFGGMELDRIHGLNWYDFVSRPYDGVGGRFPTSMDPLCEKYYDCSPYAYCGNNPVNRIDPDGRDWYQNNETKYYSWYEGNKEREGYTYIGEKGSVLGEFESIIDGILTAPDGFNTRSLYSEGFTFDIAHNDKGGLLASKERGWDFFDEFANGVGPEFSVLLSDHPYTEAMKTDKKVLQAQQAIANGETDIPGQITNVSRKWSPLNVFGTTSMAKQFIGSYRYDAFTSSDGKALNNVISDSKSRTSLFLHLPFSNQSRSKSQSRAFSNTYQFYIWKSSK